MPSTATRNRIELREPAGVQLGATLERQAIKAKVKRIKKTHPGACAALDVLLQYIDDREIRTGRRPKGV